MDPHIHVERAVVEAGPELRNVTSWLVGATTDAPSVVTTGCGQQVPYASTSSRPESVTCLPCREHARAEYLRFADRVEELFRVPSPGVDITADQIASAVARLRGLARRFT